MNSTKFLYNQAELAQAAYAGLAQGETDLASNLDALRVSTGADMSQKQAAEFAARYPGIVTQFNDTETSLSATVFKDTSGNLTLAFRGTAELTGSPNDLTPTDADIFLHGAGYDQIAINTNRKHAA